MKFRDDLTHQLQFLFLSPRVNFLCVFLDRIASLPSLPQIALLCNAFPSILFHEETMESFKKKPGTLVTKYCFHPINQSLIKRWDAWGSRGGNAVFLTKYCFHPEWQRRWGKTPGRDGIESAYVRPLRGRGNSSSRTSRAHKFAMTS